MTTLLLVEPVASCASVTSCLRMSEEMVSG